MSEKQADINVDAIAHLARLSLTEQEKKTMEEQLRAMIAFAGQLSRFDTADVPARAHVVDITNVLREDIPTACLPRDMLLQNAPTRAEEYITVPRVVESEEGKHE